MSLVSRCFRLLRRYAKYLVNNEKDKGGGGSRMGMQEYMERQMTELHYTAVHSHFGQKFLAFLLTTLCVVLLPYLHIGVFYMKIWVPDKPPVDRYGCTCSCFDTVFRGRYENPGVVTYKHVYFNATSTTLKIWIFTAVFILLFYESVRHLVGLLSSGVPLRRSMLFLYFINLYPHYYSWWSFFSYYNEELFTYFTHHFMSFFSYYNEELFTYFTHHFMFTVTEILVTAIILNLCNRDNDFSSWKLSVIITVSVVHIIVSGMDQFIGHVIQGGGHSFQNVRDVGLMVPDLLHVLVPLRVFWRNAQRQKLRVIEMCYKEEVILTFLFISLGTVLGRLM
ncbi:hypothetical protein ACOMHN_025638 [Nucella lapillus]